MNFLCEGEGGTAIFYCVFTYDHVVAFSFVCRLESVRVRDVLLD